MRLPTPAVFLVFLVLVKLAPGNVASAYPNSSDEQQFAEIQSDKPSGTVLATSLPGDGGREPATAPSDTATITLPPRKRVTLTFTRPFSANRANPQYTVYTVTFFPLPGRTSI